MDEDALRVAPAKTHQRYVVLVSLARWLFTACRAADGLKDDTTVHLLDVIARDELVSKEFASEVPDSEMDDEEIEEDEGNFGLVARCALTAKKCSNQKGPGEEDESHFGLS